MLRIAIAVIALAAAAIVQAAPPVPTPYIRNGYSAPQHLSGSRAAPGQRSVSPPAWHYSSPTSGRTAAAPRQPTMFSVQGTPTKPPSPTPYIRN